MTRKGFTLMEVMAAVMLLAITLTVIFSLRDQAVGRAANARSIAVATRMAQGLMHRIECGLAAELFDGMEGDFAEEGFAPFQYRIGLGEGSLVASENADTDSPEYAWRRSKEEAWRESEDAAEEDTLAQPPRTRIVIVVQWPDFTNETAEFRLESLVETWAVRQDFPLWEATWGSAMVEEIE